MINAAEARLKSQNADCKVVENDYGCNYIKNMINDEILRACERGESHAKISVLVLIAWNTYGKYIKKELEANGYFVVDRTNKSHDRYLRIYWDKTFKLSSKEFAIIAAIGIGFTVAVILVLSNWSDLLLN